MLRPRLATVSAALFCLSTAGQAAAQGAPPPNQPPPPYQPPPTYAAEPPPPPVTSFPGFAVIPRLGIALDGSVDGHEKQTDCTGSQCTTDEDDDGVSEASDFGAFVDFLWATAARNRMGIGLQYVPKYKISAFGQSATLGSEAQALFVFEHGIPIAGSGMFLLRGQGGLAVFFPGSDLDRCKNNSSSTTSCDSSSGPFFGPAVAGGVGYRLQGAPVRFDVLYGLHWYKGAHSERKTSTTIGMTTNTTSETRDLRFSGNRLWVTVGYEF